MVLLQLGKLDQTLMQVLVSSAFPHKAGLRVYGVRGKWVRTTGFLKA